MDSTPKPARESWSVQLPLVFGVIVVSFLAAMLVTQWQLVSVGHKSLEIADSTAPSIEHLANARGEMRHLEVILRDDVDLARGGGSMRVAEVEVTRQAMNDSISDYLQLPVEPAEQRMWGDILRTKDAFNASVDGTLARVDQHDFAAADAMLRSVAATGDALSTAITRDIELNAERSHTLALSIARSQRRSVFIAFALAAFCAAITVAGGVILRRVLQQRATLADAHRRLLEARASELEQFAGRVAHDILSPLNTVGLALRTTATTGMSDTMRTQLADRGGAAIRRIDRLVSGLLSFAVAGAEPEEGAQADVDATIGDLERELREEATGAGADLGVDVHVSHLVACNAGVLTSVVSNLARNAIKYIGDGPTRRIDLRAFETRSAIRLEVQDTGPGLLPDLEERVFEPYVRGHTAVKSGIGLGLATVKRVAVAHHGRVGVKSVVGAGCTFWVELPKGDDLAPNDRATGDASLVH